MLRSDSLAKYGHSMKRDQRKKNVTNESKRTKKEEDMEV